MEIRDWHRHGHLLAKSYSNLDRGVQITQGAGSFRPIFGFPTVFLVQLCTKELCLFDKGCRYQRPTRICAESVLRFRAVGEQERSRADRDT